MHASLIFLVPLILLSLFTRHSTSLRIFAKRNERMLCPMEYQSCMCNFTSGNRISNNLENTEHQAVMIDCSKTKNFNQIPAISNKHWSFLKQVTQLELSYTNISEVQTEAFRGLTGLKTILITHCSSLKKIDMFAFRNLPNLKTLIISYNPELTSLEPHAFGSLKNLNYLSLSNNNLKVIDGYVFSSSTGIKIISLIGNPIKKIKSHAFHGLRNVTDLMISLNQNVAPIEVIEGDAFISLAFVDQIFLDGIHSRQLLTNTFRGMSYCKTLHLSNTYIEKIHADAFFRANHIETLNLRNSRVKVLSKDAFSSMFNIGTIDMSGNYISKLDKMTFEPLIKIAEDFHKDNLKNVINKSSIVLINEPVQQKHLVKKILLEQNPIQCDCNLDWLLVNKIYTQYISLPEICAGPRGFDCLRINDLTVDKLACKEHNKNIVEVPCQDLEFSYNKTQKQILNEIFSIQKEDGQKQFIDKFVEDVDSEENEYYDDDYNYDYNYYTVENVPQSELDAYTSTSTRRMRKKVSKEPKPSTKISVDSDMHMQRASIDTTKLNIMKTSNAANKNKISFSFSIGSYKNILNFCLVMFVVYFVMFLL